MISIVIAIGIGMVCGCVILFVIGTAIYIYGKKTENAIAVDKGTSLLSITSIIMRFGAVVLILGLVLLTFEIILRIDILITI